MRQAVGRVSEADRLFRRTGIVLQEDETLIFMSIIHNAIFWKGVAVLMFSVLLLFTFFQNLGFLFFFVGAVMVALAGLTQKYLLLAATNKRIFIRSGIFYTDMIEMRYSQLESIELGINPIGQMFGYGSVILTGTGQRRIIVPYVANALEFRSRVNELLLRREE